jgi:urease accessory protein
MPSSDPPDAGWSASVPADYLRMLLADGRLPTGAHTQSGGLEPAFNHGMRLDQVPDYLRVRLRTVTEVEAAASVVARWVWLNTPQPLRASGLSEVDDAWRARTPSDAIRVASDLLGRSYARMANSLWPLNLGESAIRCRAVVVGATAAAAGIGPAETARMIGFEDVQTVIAAALKIKPFDPNLGVRWAAAAGAEVERMVSRVAHLHTIDQIPAHSAPQIEQWSQAHLTTERRLYRA